jgi:molybdopterin converting factor subunit 1
MRVKLRLFAILRERAGTGATELELPAGATVGTAVAALGASLPAVAPLLPVAARAVNLQYVRDERVLADGDELALIPPVSGG